MEDYHSCTNRHISDCAGFVTFALHLFQKKNKTNLQLAT